MNTAWIDHAGAAALHMPSASQAIGAAAAGSGVVLIVDDTPDNLALLSDALDAVGYTVLVALDGPSALDRIERLTPDIILLDAVMPGISGFETCEHIKANARHAQIPVIFMTGLTESEHVVRGFRAGGIDYITKPIRPEEVLARVAAHLERARAHRQADEIVGLGGRAALVADVHGAIHWRSSRVAPLFARFYPDHGDMQRLPPVLQQWLAQSVGPVGAPEAGRMAEDGEAVRLVARLAGPAPHSAWVIQLEEHDDRKVSDRLCARFRLTAREAEVLLWISRGKTNRDIGDILGMRPRTVNKHLEHIFEKLGVETRAAAAALALQAQPG
jgi:DNA-binding NarL/FixJ family response regulator